MGSGRDRVTEVAQQLPGEIGLNIQDDEALAHPDLFRDLVATFPGHALYSLRYPIPSD